MGWMALLDESDKEIGVVGDSAWDIMGAAVQEVRTIYLTEIGRQPTDEELVATFEFVAMMDKNIVLHNRESTFSTF